MRRLKAMTAHAALIAALIALGGLAASCSRESTKSEEEPPYGSSEQKDTTPGVEPDTTGYPVPPGQP